VNPAGATSSLTASGAEAGTHVSVIARMSKIVSCKTPIRLFTDFVFSRPRPRQYVTAAPFEALVHTDEFVFPQTQA